MATRNSTRASRPAAARPQHQPQRDIPAPLTKVATLKQLDDEASSEVHSDCVEAIASIHQGMKGLSDLLYAADPGEVGGEPIKNAAWLLRFLANLADSLTLLQGCTEVRYVRYVTSKLGGAA